MRLNLKYPVISKEYLFSVLMFFSCRFIGIPSVVYELRLLRVLNLSNNKLTDINSAWCGLEKLHHLDTLDLSNNEIPQLPPELGLMTHLK